MSAHRTGGSGCGCLPTPTTSDATCGAILNEDTDIYFLKSGMPRKRSNQGVDGSIGLSRFVQVMWPTPKQRDWQGMSQRGLHQPGDALPNAVNAASPGGTPTRQMWATPREFAHKDSTTDRGKCNLREQVGGQLNPDWVEWLMGWPIGLTDLKPLAMDRFRLWLRLHGAC